MDTARHHFLLPGPNEIVRDFGRLAAAGTGRVSRDCPDEIVVADLPAAPALRTR